MAETVVLTKPASQTTFSLVIFVSLAVYLAGRIIEVLPFTTPSTPIVAIEILSALVFALAHGARHLGLRSILVFAAMCLAIGGAMETIGLRTGFPFGHYEFLPLMGPQIAQLPVLLGLAYIGMAYASWCVALLIVGISKEGISGGKLIGVPLVASVAMTAWDFAQDPVWSTLLHAWRWRDSGPWLGVPLTNFGGWLLTTFLIYIAFAAYLRNRRSARDYGAENGWRAPIVLYGLCALGNVLQLLKPQANEFVADNRGNLWATGSILRHSALVSVFIMGGFAAAAIARASKIRRGDSAA